MKLRDHAKSLGLDVGCQSNECRWGECDGAETVDYCDCDDRRGARYESEDMARVAQHLAAEVDRMRAEVAQLAGDVRHLAGVDAECARMSPVVEAARKWREDKGLLWTALCDAVDAYEKAVNRG
jgi:hypothetical protein